MRILIIEDEALLAEVLKKELLSLLPDAEIVAVTASVEESVRFLSSHPDPDIIFSDIRLEDGLCFSIFDKVKTSSRIIFTTAYDEYAIKAFDYNCIDYLLKPLTTSGLQRALKKTGMPSPATLDELSKDFHSGNIYRRRLLLKHGDNDIIVKAEDIVIIQTDLGDTRAYTESGLWGTVNLSLKELGNSLDPTVFIQANRQTIVNLDDVKSISHSIMRHPTLHIEVDKRSYDVAITPAKEKEILSLLGL